MNRTLFLIGMLVWLSGTVHAQDYLPPIDDPNFRPYPLAVPNFKLLGSGGSKLADQGLEILCNDLAITGSFRLLDPKSFLADPSKEGITSSAINFADWLNVGAEGLVKVGLAISGSEVTLDFHLFDVATGKELVHKKASGSFKQLRQLVHAFADRVVKHFTGLRSVFSTQIVFTKKHKKEKYICIMDFDGHNERCVVKNGSINLLPDWSADGTGFYYSSYLKGGPHVYYYDLKTGSSKVISKQRGLNIGVAAAPNGRMIAVTLSRDDNSEIYRMRPDGSRPVRLTRNWSIDSSASFSPDSKKIAFVSERAGNPQIYVMTANGKKTRRLTFRGTYNQTPDWSPRGDWILFNARDERLGYDIFKINPNTNEIRRLTQDQGNNEHPDFSPDGNLVVFSSTRSGDSKLYIMNADGSNQRQISRGKGEYSTPDWGPWPQKK